MSVRSTQRAPQSCIDRSRRKVKCNKQIPCDVCIRRGTPLACAREKVRIKIKRNRDTISSDGTAAEEDLTSRYAFSMDSTAEEESAEFSVASAPPMMQTSPTSTAVYLETPPRTRSFLDDDPEGFERHLFELVGNAKSTSTVASESDVEFPSASLSEVLLRRGEHTNWAHCAVHYPTFAVQHAAFWKACANARERALYDPFWLALYFSVLSAVLIFSDEVDGLEDADFMGSSCTTRLQKWYDAALFYLHKAEFLRNPDLRTVQTTAILTVVFKNVGDFNMYQVMMPIAVRTAQILKIDREAELQKRDPVEQEVCRRAWWTLVICEWLPVPYHPPSISEGDFDVRFPAARNDEELGQYPEVLHPQDYPRPIQYHLAMAKSAVLYRRFRARLQSGGLTQAGVVDLVIQTDEELAYIIANLPSYLCAASGTAASWSPALDYERFPWIPTQRITLGIFLLDLRITINKTLQNIWLDHSVLFRRTRSICLTSAEAMLALTVGHSRVLQKWPSTWASVAHSFSTAVILAIEAQITGDGVDSNASGSIW